YLVDAALSYASFACSSTFGQAAVSTPEESAGPFGLSVNPEPENTLAADLPSGCMHSARRYLRGLSVSAAYSGGVGALSVNQVAAKTSRRQRRSIGSRRNVEAYGRSPPWQSLPSVQQLGRPSGSGAHGRGVGGLYRCEDLATGPAPGRPTASPTLPPPNPSRCPE